jgi:O-antigen/teichoic acid export membrane protein
LAYPLDAPRVVWIVGAGLLASGIACVLATGAPIWSPILEGFARLPTGFAAYALPFHVSTGVVFLAGSYDTLLAGAAGGVRFAGIYKIAVLGRTLARWLPATLAAPLYPMLRRAHTTGDLTGFGALVGTYLRMLVTAGVWSGAILVAGTPWFVGLFGAAYGEAVNPYLVAVVGSSALTPISLVLGTALTARGLVTPLLAVNCVTLVLGCILGWLALPVLGLVGVALSTVALSAVNVVWSSVLLGRSGTPVHLGKVLASGTVLALLGALRAASPRSAFVGVVLLAVGSVVPSLLRILRIADIRALRAAFGPQNAEERGVADDLPLGPGALR